ncbi:protein of unknown function [Methylococcus capsulatus]|uniref:Uncharacterized protein n=1 Tax=Methylococcus capsulatus TaxID=414 RepID=A0AA35V2A6_METCP|nr:protein of unknown function [Methylococcus capsulatus]
MVRGYVEREKMMCGRMNRVRAAYFGLGLKQLLKIILNDSPALFPISVLLSGNQLHCRMVDSVYRAVQC